AIVRGTLHSIGTLSTRISHAARQLCSLGTGCFAGGLKQQGVCQRAKSRWIMKSNICYLMLAAAGLALAGCNQAESPSQVQQDVAAAQAEAERDVADAQSDARDRMVDAHEDVIDAQSDND